MELTLQDYLHGLTSFAKGLSVLYAEDELEVRSQVEHFLRKFFEDVRIAVDGLEAWTAFGERGCDILVTDIKMPQMDGIELCRKVIEVDPLQRIVVVSAYNETDYLMQLINMGVDKFILKPFDNKQSL